MMPGSGSRPGSEMADYTAISRGEWIALADRFYAKLDRTFAMFSPEEWALATPYLGWRAHDILAHMTSAIRINFRQVLDRALSGNPSAPPEFNTFARNAREVARHRTTPVADLLREFHAELDAIMSIYRGMNDDDWLRPAWFFVGRVQVRTLFLVQLADNVVHERDLLVASDRWRGFDATWTEPLVDWFLRELRPALFRPERAENLRARVLYRLSGPLGGEWTLVVADGRCHVERGATGDHDVVVEADAEDVVVSAQARAAPWIGTLARSAQWIRGPARAEDVVAKITGLAALAGALAQRRLRVGGDRQIARRLTGAFWHFWQRTEMTARNIAKG